MERKLLEEVVQNTKQNTEILKQIVRNTEPKESFQIKVTGNKTRFTRRFNPLIQLKKNKSYDIALLNLETYYSFPNITRENCRFTYSPGEGYTWHHILIPEGSYEIKKHQ